jgi:hypothetical protein
VLDRSCGKRQATDGVSCSHSFSTPGPLLPS